MTWLKDMANLGEGMECDECKIGTLKISEEDSTDADILFVCTSCGQKSISYGVISEEEKEIFARKIFGIAFGN